MLEWIFPGSQSTSFTTRAFLLCLALLSLFVLVALLRRRRVIAVLAASMATVTLGFWLFLYVDRPPWMRHALAAEPPTTKATTPHWVERAPGLETAELEITANGVWVDRLAVTRIDPDWYRFTVHWDKTASRSIEDWQKTLGATAVINGSYFHADGSPQTPLRSNGVAAGPAKYTSSHGAFVASGSTVDVLDLRGKDLFQEIRAHSEAMVSYPLLLDSSGRVRARGTSDWLASRAFVGRDVRGRMLLGTTITGFFSLRRFGLFLKSAPLHLQVALNLDGGPVAGHAVKTEHYERVQVGIAETNSGNDVLRAFYQRHRTSHAKLPIVLAVTPR